LGSRVAVVAIRKVWLSMAGDELKKKLRRRRKRYKTRKKSNRK
jgi:hypothetical protein